MFAISIFIFSAFSSTVFGQLSTSAPFVCVPVGTCGNQPNGTNTIDPRIVTPNQALCPAGQEPCYGGSTTGQCGRRYVTNINTADGPSTFGAYPWLAYISNQTGYTGVGVLINSQTLITAAHKVNTNVATPSNIRVSMGVWNPTILATTQNTTASSIVLHPNFNSSTLWNDIAVVRLATPIALGIQTNIGTACLPPAGSSYVGRTCTVAGWGQTAFGAYDAPTAAQKQVTVPIVTYAACRTSMSSATLLGSFVDRYLDPSGEICAGGQSQLDACTQDGGAPLVCPDPATGQFYIAGLVIWGKKCGQPNVYGVYVSVPFYRTWIDSVISTFG